MRRMALPFVLLAAVVFTVCSTACAADAGDRTTANAGDAKKADSKQPADRVVVIYFHRTQRCPTCLKMGSYSEEAVVKGFPKEVQEGTIEFRTVDFQDSKNAAITKAYKVTGPSLMTVKVVAGKPVAAENLKEIWAKSTNKTAFLTYVRDHIAACRNGLVAKPANRVVVVYFHRTQRCPTCLRMGSYAEEAVLKGFPREVKDGTVEFRYVDFENPKNAAVAKAYQVTGPSLVAVKIVAGKPVAAENLQEIWAMNGDKAGFLTYVRDHVAAYQESLPKTAMKPATGSPPKAK